MSARCSTPAHRAPWPPGAALEVSVAAGWLAVAALTFRHLAEQGRRTGAIEFAD